MADTVRGIWQSIVQTKRLYLNPHEHFGRANICRAALLSYVGMYYMFKWNQNRKVKRFPIVILKKNCSFSGRNCPRREKSCQGHRQRRCCRPSSSLIQSDAPRFGLIFFYWTIVLSRFVGLCNAMFF